ncbi:hypothetical protein HBHAL_2960 [Halobacillus halophilus DSM 2266]|uniref:Uncharacterized protein n=1 Tax=Halobacillus halophilus (strain ATCC 35676 / DSM 2266 / JCM 20832 / KCTC 3685 / LMG 17431 / NBRC 102448 / NCIMB 2269) TaxID=866895 RepID=I0JMD8_HALH3|nr:hypothetical protein HBHAL_2960 [Halobacillus halophilus DSM 2266]
MTNGIFVNKHEHYLPELLDSRIMKNMDPIKL